MIKRFYILLLAIVASVGMSFAQDPGIVSSGTKGGMSYTFYDNGLLEISGSGALPGSAFTNWDGGFGTSVKNIRFAEDCEVYGLDYLWFACYTENSQLETVEINSVTPIMFSGTSGAGIFYRQDGAVTITITAPGIVDVENRIIDTYGSPVNMIFNMPATTVFEKKWFSGLENYFAVTIPTGATGHIPAGYVFKDSYDQEEYDHLVADGYEDMFWDTHSNLVEGVDYTLGVESTFVITAENASQIFGKATVSFQAPTEASNSEWVLWRKSDLKEFPDMSSGNQKVCKDVTVKVNNGVYNTDSGWGIHFESLAEDGVQFVAPEGKVFKRIVILNEYGTFSDSNWSYDKNYKRWSGSADTVGFVGNICGISLIEFELGDSAPANSCGGGLTWELENGALTISYDGEGTGVMNDYDIPNDNPAPWYANREDITSVSLPEGIKTIGKDAFRDCVNLTTVTIPNSVTTIGESAFVTVEHLETVTIGTGITSIVNGAFYGNAELTTVTCSATTPPSIGGIVFGSCTNLEHIYVPAASVDAYKSAWSDYASLIEAIGGGSTTTTVTWNSSNISDLIVFSTSESYSKEGVTLSGNADKIEAYWYGSDENLSGISFHANATGGFTFSNTLGKNFTKIEMTLNNPGGWNYANLGSEWNIDGMKAIWTGNASTVDLLKDESNFNSTPVKSVVFYFEGDGGGSATTVVTITEADFPIGGESLTKDGVTVSAGWIEGNSYDIYGDGSFSTTLGNFTKIEVCAAEVSPLGEGWSGNSECQTWTGNASSVSFSDNIMGNSQGVTLKFTIGDAAATPAYETVMNLINEIGTVELTAECKAKIDAARAAFIALSDGDKTQVTNYETLTTAEAAFDNVMDIWLSGDCDAILWKDTTLTIRKHAGEGNGAMADYTSYYGDNTAPWFNSHWYNPQPGDIVIKSITIEEGVTRIGDYAFGWMSELKTLTIPSSVTSIGEDAFYWSKAVDDIYLTVADPSNLTWVLPYSADNQFKPEKATRCHVPADLLTAYQETFGTLNMTFVGDLDPITPLTPEQQQALDAAKDKIAAIPSPVVYTPACKDAIDAARAAYDALTPDMLKQLVSNYATLTAAEATYESLKDVAVAEAKIAAIPQPVTLKLATRDSIESARAAYDALTADQKLLVSNYAILEAAEATMATLNPGGDAPDGAVNGKFSIDESSVVYFSKGNLQATTADLGANWTWGFAANQWNTIGNVAANNAISGNGTVSANGTVDLFGWSTSATKYGIHNGTNSNISDYAGDFVDWGTTIGEGWFTLSKDQWHCLLNTRTGDKAATVNSVADCRYTKATINTDGTAAMGMILFPDGGTFAASEFTEVGSPNTEDANYTTTCTTAQWNALQAKGCVFLPAAGRRYGAEVSTEDPNGYYWSSSPKPSTGDAYYVFFYSYGMYAPNDFRCLGLSVRLVTEAPASPLNEAQAVKDLIEAIPAEITLEDNCVKAVQAARDAYNALAEATKGALDDATVQKLNQAITDYTALIQAGADEVIAKINNIPQPVTLKLATRDSIESARAAYDALTADQKLLVSNYDVLTAAEATWAGLTNVAPTGALSGKYTINDGGDVIYFAHGNLQYTRENLDADWSTGTFRLAENQYDLIELDKTYPAAYCTDNYGDKIAVGLFGWGTWGEGKTPNLTSSDRTLYTWSTDFSGTLEGTDTWRTLTKDEWVYLLAHNNQSYATVHGVNGLLVAPDGKDIEGKSMTDWVEINDETWTTMQNDGYLFLPACGQRSRMSETANITTGDQGEDVVYYSSTEYSNVYAYNIWYKPGQDPKADDYSNKRQAFGIRLVSAGVNPLDQVQVVKGLIDAIPVPVTLDDACVNAVQAARAGYDALDTDAKAILDAADVKKLTDAEAALTALNQAEADKVIAKINAIPQPVELKLATHDSINNARAAYDALNAAQQALVSNYQTLLDAEAALAEKNPGVSPATPLDSAQAVKDLIDAILTPVEYPTSGPAIAAALNAFNELSDAAKGALDAADVQKLNDAATLYAALEAIAAIEAIPAEIVYDPAVKVAIETAREKYDALSDASKELVDDEVVAKLTNAEQAWADLVAKVEHNVSYMGKDGELKNEKVALLHIPDPAPDFNGYEFVRWDVKGGDFLEEGLRIKAVYTPIITTNPQGFDTLAYNGLAQELVEAGVAKEGHIEYSLYPEEPESWSAELPKATFAGVYAIYYKLVREGHADYIAPEPTMATIAKVPVTYTAPTAVESLVYNASNQTLIAAGQTQDGTFEYSLAPTLLDSWKAELPQAKDAGTYSVYYRVQGDLNHLDSTAVDPIAVTIAKAPLTATADDKSIIYGDLAPEFTVTYAGWQGTEGASVLTGEIAYACEYVKGHPVGEYVITPSGVDANNYTIEFVKGKLTVNSKSAKSDDITAKQADNEMLVYDAAANKPTIQAKDTTKTLVEDTDYKLTFIGRGDTEYAENATAPAHVGEYTAIVAFIGNYTDTLTVDFVINKAPLTITADDKEVTFGEFAPEFTVSYEGWQGEDTATVLTGSQAYACEYVRGNQIGDYTIIPSGVDAHDYAITFVNGTLTVNRKSAKSADITAKQADNEKLVYDAEANRPTIQVKDTTLVLTEAQDYVLTFMGVAADQTPYAESETAPTHVGNYKAIVAFIGNYIDTLTVDFMINKAPLTITADDKEMIYGDEHPEFTVSYNGWFGNDDESVILGTQAYDCVYAPGSPIGTYVITPKDVDAYDYAITFVDGTLTVNKAHVYVSDAEAQIAKFADGHANAVVLEQGILNGIKLNDPIAHVTTAAFSSADVAEHLTITLSYELTGDAALLNNYYLDPTSDIFTNEGVIIEPFIPDNEEKPEDKEATVNEGIEIYAYGYCDGSGYSLKYHLESGNPDQYKIDFADSRFTDVDWTNLVITGKDGTIDIEIPVDMPTGDYTMTVYFRDSRFDWLESRQFNVTFHVNLPETYVRPLFDNVIALVDTCECLTDIQWYWRANSTDLWQPIEGANGYYYHVDGKLTGEYFVSAKMNGEPTYTCGQADMETLYGADQQAEAPVVRAYPNPVVNSTTVTIENSIEWIHNIRIVNLMGAEVMNATFEGDKTSVEMSGYPQGNYMISVDGIVVKVMKK